MGTNKNITYTKINTKNNNYCIMCISSQRNRKIKKSSLSIAPCSNLISRDYYERRKMVKLISLLLHRRKNANENYVKIIPKLSQQLELRLYNNATSLSEYSDVSTLGLRMKDIVSEVNHFQFLRKFQNKLSI